MSTSCGQLSLSPFRNDVFVTDQLDNRVTYLHVRLILIELFLIGLVTQLESLGDFNPPGWNG